MRAAVRRSLPVRTLAVSIRQHEIGITNGAGDHGSNTVPGTVMRNVFLGDARDYVVETKDGSQLRITAPPESEFRQRHAPCGWTLPPQRCRALLG